MKLRVFAFVWLLCFPCFSQGHLEVRIGNYSNGTAFLWNTNSAACDTIIIRNGFFEATPQIDEPTLFYLMIEGINDLDLPMRLILSSNKTTLRFTSVTPATMGFDWSKLYPNHPEYMQDPNHNALLSKFESDWLIFSDTITKLTNEDSEQTSSMSQRAGLYNSYISQTEQLLKDNSSQVASAVALYEFLIRNNLIDIKKTKHLYNILDEGVRYTGIGIRIGEHINKLLSLEIGSKAPYFEFSDINNKKYNLLDFNGRTILLHFWASTCGPCRVENQELGNLIGPNEKIAIVNISLDISDAKWRKAVQKDGLEMMLNACDLKGMNGTIAEAFYVHGIPMHYLIDENGLIIAKGTAREIKNQIQK